MVVSAYGGKLTPEIDGAVVSSLGDEYYFIRFAAILCTGSAVVSRHLIPFPHQIVNIKLKHVDANLADSTDSLTFKHKVSLGTLNFEHTLSSVTSTASDVIKRYTAEIVNACVHAFSANTTSTHYVYVTMLVKRIGEL